MFSKFANVEFCVQFDFASCNMVYGNFYIEVSVMKCSTLNLVALKWMIRTMQILQFRPFCCYCEID